MQTFSLDEQVTYTHTHIFKVVMKGEMVHSHLPTDVSSSGWQTAGSPLWQVCPTSFEALNSPNQTILKTLLGCEDNVSSTTSLTCIWHARPPHPTEPRIKQNCYFHSNLQPWPSFLWCSSRSLMAPHDVIITTSKSNPCLFPHFF